jgi:hypothetical protein
MSKSKWSDGNDDEKARQKLAKRLSEEENTRCPRLDKCAVDDDKMVGYPLSRITVCLEEPGQPWIDVATVDECLKCGFIAASRLLPRAAEFGITLRAVEILCRKGHRRNFSPEEFAEARRSAMIAGAPRPEPVASLEMPLQI